MALQQTIPHYNITTPVRASYAQEGMWFVEQLTEGDPAYNIVNGIRLEGPLNADVLRKSIDEIVRAQSALRTFFFLDNGQVYQNTAAPFTTDLPVLDLSGLSRGLALSKVEEIAIIEGKRPFDLTSAPLFRLFLQKISPEEHILTLIIHHTVFDGWSFNVILGQLAAHYKAFLHGTSPGSPESPVRYTDYSSWKREKVEGGGFDAQLEYWMGVFSHELPVLELPVDRPRPAVQSFEADVRTRLIPVPLSDALKAIGRRERATLFIVLLTSFNILLERYTGQKDIIIGCPVAGRNYRELEGLVGPFLNTLPMRSDLTGDPSFLTLLRQVRKNVFEAFSNQDLPFEKLVEKLHIDRMPDRTPLFQALFQLRNYPAPRMDSSIRMERYDFHYSTAKTDLILDVADTPSGLYCRFVYPKALFDRATMERMAGQWQTLLESIAENPEKNVSLMEILSPEERRQILYDWNRTRTDYPRDTAVHRIFEGRAKVTSDATAISHGNASITYRQLNSRSNKLAGYLKSIGVCRQMPVAVYMDRSIDLIMCQIAILKAGGVYVPIDPADPPERSAFMLKDAGADVILIKTWSPVANSVRRAICLDDEADEISRQGDEDLPDALAAEAVAYIMYTSGSTGQPKGVEVTHRAINRLALNANYVNIGPGDVMAHISNPAFDAATFEVWGALLNGARLVIYDKNTILSPVEFTSRLNADGITTMFLTTQLFNVLARESPGAFKNIRDLLTGGETADPSSVKLVLTQSPPRRLLNVYGPTENTTFSTWSHIREVPPGGIIPIGRPVSNTAVYILDGYRRPVPIGSTGEIYLGGDGVAAGYHRRPDQTAAAFIPDPFSPEGTLYRTGDLGCYLPDGNIRFMGRRDTQLKVRGFRVETGEIKAVLESLPSVKASLVAMKKLKGEDRLVAYVLPQDGQSIDEIVLRGHLRARLPEYMIPSAFIAISAIPLTPTGKVDYRALPGPGERAQAEADRPADDLERTLACIWEEVLGIPAGINDDFFDLGGHSLAAIRVFAKIDEKLNIKLPVNTIYLSPTIRRMASAIRAGPAAQDLPLLLRKGSLKPPLFCITAIGGTLDEYRPLLEEIHCDLEAYALQMPWHDPGQIPDSIEALAGRLITDVTSIQPHGPYRFLGYCAGGGVAYEMAIQLSGAGEEVSFLGLVDLVPPPYHYRPDIRSMKLLAGTIRQALSNVIHAPRGQRQNKIMSAPAALGQFLRNIFPRPPIKGPEIVVSPPHPDWVMAMPETYRDVTISIYSIYKKYAFKPYKGNAMLFISSKNLDNYKDTIYYGPALGWEKYVMGKVKTFLIPGDHVTMTRHPNVKVLAAAVEECLAEPGSKSAVSGGRKS